MTVSGTMKNRGKIYLIRSDVPWRMADDEPAGEVTGAEFEAFFRELDSFISGYFYALGFRNEPAYAQGDYLGERTDAIHFTDRVHLTQTFVLATQHWLSAERRHPWRVLIVGKNWDDNYIVI